MDVRTRAEAVSRLQSGVAATTSIEDASARIGIGRSLGYQLAREDRFPVPVIRAGRRLLVPTAALERLLSGLPVQAEERRAPG
jgi:hypothetical protein